jgi:hypothetical protein
VKMGQLVDSEEEIWQFWERGRDVHVSHRGSERERFRKSKRGLGRLGEREKIRGVLRESG